MANEILPLQSIYKYTYREFQLFPSDGNRHEIIDGDHYMNPAPSLRHQTVSRRLQYQWYTQLELPGKGQVFDAPTDVELALHDIVEPDLIVVLKEKYQLLTPKRIRGVPDLVIEILSPSNPDHDRILKLEMYGRVQLPEYWIVDPEEDFVEVYTLDDRKLMIQGTFRDLLRPLTIPDVTIDLQQVWVR